jgi:hypothetical protein
MRGARFIGRAQASNPRAGAVAPAGILRRVRQRSLTLSAALVIAAAGALALISGGHAAAATPSGPACGAASSGVVYAIDNRIVHGIYENELGSAEVRGDLDHITSSTVLARAVAAGNAKQILAATHTIVYTPHWHIVRLRVLSLSGKVLADVGGPYIIAPIPGQITYNGRVVGRFITSVQDDRGYKKLVTSIAGLPIEIYRNGRPLMGSVTNPPSTPPPSGPLTLNRIHYTVDAYNAAQFPTGTLRIVVLIPAPSATLTELTCPEIHLQTITAVVQRVAIGLTNAGFPFLEHTNLFVSQAEGYAEGPIFVLDGSQELAGTNELNGSSAPSPPSDLPLRGQVSYDGSQWLVDSFDRYVPVLVYVLQPESQPAGASGPTGAS